MDLAYKNGLPSFKLSAGRAISGSSPIQSRPIPFSPAPFVLITSIESIHRAGKPVGHLIEALTKFQAAPSLLGFGISEPAQVKEAIASGAAGAISGSAVVKIIEKNLADPAQMLAQLEQFVRQMKAATAY